AALFIIIANVIIKNSFCGAHPLPVFYSIHVATPPPTCPGGRCMAVPLTQPDTSEQRPPAVSRFRTWLRTLGASLLRPIVAIIFAFITGAVVILITWPDKTVDPFTNVIHAYTTLFSGSYGTLPNISTTLVQVIPLTLASLSVAIAFRAGLFNIGAAGQLAAGGTVADMIGLTHQSWPAWLLVPTMILAGMAAGAALGAIVRFLKA